jgi:small subunit ribosomal protein S13
MPRIAGVTIPTEKRVEVALTYIFGIGFTKSKEILEKANVENKRVKDLTDEEESRIRKIIEEEYRVEGDLRREVAGNIKRLKEINCYRGDRHKKGMPVRGQSTRK